MEGCNDGFSTETDCKTIKLIDWLIFSLHKAIQNRPIQPHISWPFRPTLPTNRCKNLLWLTKRIPCPESSSTCCRLHWSCTSQGHPNSRNVRGRGVIDIWILFPGINAHRFPWTARDEDWDEWECCWWSRVVWWLFANVILYTVTCFIFWS